MPVSLILRLILILPAWHALIEKQNWVRWPTKFYLFYVNNVKDSLKDACELIVGMHIYHHIGVLVSGSQHTHYIIDFVDSWLFFFLREEIKLGTLSKMLIQ